MVERSLVADSDLVSLHQVLKLSTSAKRFHHAIGYTSKGKSSASSLEVRRKSRVLIQCPRSVVNTKTKTGKTADTRLATRQQVRSVCVGKSKDHAKQCRPPKTNDDMAIKAKIGGVFKLLSIQIRSFGTRSRYSIRVAPNSALAGALSRSQKG